MVVVGDGRGMGADDNYPPRPVKRSKTNSRRQSKIQTKQQKHKQTKIYTELTELTTMDGEHTEKHVR